MPAVLRQHPNAKLMLAGDGELQSQLREQTRRLGIESSVQFLGYRGDVPDLIHGCDLFVIEALSALIAVSAELVARERRDLLEPVWRATVAAIVGSANGAGGRREDFLAATAGLGAGEDGAPLLTLAATLGPTPGLKEALTA